MALDGLRRALRSWMGLDAVIASSVTHAEEANAGRSEQREADRLVNQFAGWTYVAAFRNAQAVASVPMRVYRRRQSTKDRIAWATRAVERKAYERIIPAMGVYAAKSMGDLGEMEEVIAPDHPLVRLLNRANPWTSGSEHQVGRQLALELAGNSYEAMVLDGRMPMQLWLLEPQSVRLVPSREGYIDRYVYGRNPGIERDYPASQIVHGRMPGNPNTPYLGYPPLAACLRESELSAEFVAAATSYMQNGAHPSFLVHGKSLTPSQVELISREINRKYAGSRKTGRAFVVGGDVMVSQFSQARGAELSFMESDRAMRDKIANVFGMSSALLTMDTAALATATAAMPNWQRMAILPRCRLRDDSYNESLVGVCRELLGDPGLFVQSDNPIEQDKDSIIARVSTLRSQGIITLNEARSELDYEPVEGGDAIGGASAAVGRDDDEREDGEVESKEDEEDDAEEDEEEEEEPFVTKSRMPAYAEGCSHGIVHKALSPEEARLTRRIDEWFSGLDVVHGPGTIRIGSQDAESLLEIMRSELYAVMRDEGLRAAAGADPTALSALPRSIVAFLDGYVPRLASEIMKETEERLAHAIGTGIREGLDGRALTEAVSDALGSESMLRAERIARTETALVRGRAYVMGRESAGAETKRWILAPGSCKFCVAVAARGEVPIGEPFVRLGETVTAADGDVYVCEWMDVQAPPLHPYDRCAVA